VAQQMAIWRNSNASSLPRGIARREGPIGSSVVRYYRTSWLSRASRACARSHLSAKVIPRILQGLVTVKGIVGAENASAILLCADLHFQRAKPLYHKLSHESANAEESKTWTLRPTCGAPLWRQTIGRAIAPVGPERFPIGD
jgi:hypothetical protein